MEGSLKPGGLASQIMGSRAAVARLSKKGIVSVVGETVRLLGKIYICAFKGCGDGT